MGKYPKAAAVLIDNEMINYQDVIEESIRET